MEGHPDVYVTPQLAPPAHPAMRSHVATTAAKRAIPCAAVRAIRPRVPVVTAPSVTILPDIRVQVIEFDPCEPGRVDVDIER